VSHDLVWSSYARGLRLRGRSTATIATYGYSYRNLARWSGKSPIDLTRLEIEAWMDHRLSVVKRSTVANDGLNMRIFYGWAVREELIAKNPMERITLPSSDSAPKRVIPKRDIQALLTTCKGKRFYDVRDTAIIRLLCEVGTPRVGELVGMTLDSVNLATDLVSLSGKSGHRIIPAGDRTAAALERYLRARSRHRLSKLDALWLGERGALGDCGVQSMLVERSRQAGIERVTPHLFRHWTAAQASEAGMPDSLMESLYGWSDGSVMGRHYARSTRAVRAQNAARRLALGDRL
jgi:site-specific recombinase XerD